jgi:spermidine synthase
MRIRSNILKLAVFATGLSGIVAEYILSTLATYFLGNSVFQWTIIVSIMLFAMGLGSRISKMITKNLLSKFIYIEFTLSVLVSFSALIAYISSVFTVYTGAIIYFLSIAIGLLIGMEIPLVIRLNKDFDSLRVNISSVLEKDYYGSLVGGLFFAFIGLPIIGLTYTPFILGGVNFIMAIVLFFTLWKIHKKKTKSVILTFASITLLLISYGCISSSPIITYGEQAKYKDKVIFEKQSKYQKIVVTQWKDDYWLYLNGNQQLCTYDEVMYHEPIVHPVMQLSKNPANILVLGGGDGCAVRELLKYKSVKRVDLVDIDPEMTNLGKEHPVFTALNNNAFNNEKVNIYNIDAYKYLEETKSFYDIIIIDLPDPRSVELNRLYSYEFYKLCYKQLRKHGFLITQAGSPYYAAEAYNCINKTMTKAGYNTLKMHNQILTLGEWGWILGAKHLKSEELKQNALKLRFDNVHTRWINNESMKLITSFGKPFFIKDTSIIKVNKIHNPVLYRYYLKGSWDLY